MNTFQQIAALNPPLSQMWMLRPREQTGLFIISQRGTLLARVDTASGLIYFWDKRAGVEIEVSIWELFTGKIGV